MFANYFYNPTSFRTPSPMSPSPSFYPTASTEIPSVSAQPTQSSQPSKSLQPSKALEYLGVPPNNSTNGTIIPSTQPVTSSEPTYEPSKTPEKIELTTLFGWVDQLLPEISQPTAVPTINLSSLDNSTSQSPSMSPTEIPSTAQTSISSEIIFPPTSQPSKQDNTVDGTITSMNPTKQPTAKTSEPNIIVSTPVKDEAWWDVENASSSISLWIGVPLLTSITVILWM